MGCQLGFYPGGDDTLSCLSVSPFRLSSNPSPVCLPSAHPSLALPVRLSVQQCLSCLSSSPSLLVMLAHSYRIYQRKKKSTIPRYICSNHVTGSGLCLASLLSPAETNTHAPPHTHPYSHISKHTHRHKCTIKHAHIHKDTFNSTPYVPCISQSLPLVLSVHVLSVSLHLPQSTPLILPSPPLSLDLPPSAGFLSDIRSQMASCWALSQSRLRY